MIEQQRIAGAILAGGQSRRFGSDKALAPFDGRALIDHVAAGLAVQSEALIVVGRVHGGLTSVADRPRAGLGPLGGLAGALHWARANGFAAVLSAPCDAPMLPGDLATRLAGESPAYVAGLPVIGWWPARLTDELDRWLAEDRSRAMRHWAAAAGARRVVLDVLPANVNTAEDLAALRR
jgi:molybdopterin-guanine dinucleotide biosynthesis protein A